MANTNKGYYYPGQNEYGDSEADVLFHMKKMAESMDDVLEREEEQRGEEKENLQEQISQNAEDISEIEAEQIIQNNKINKNKTDIEALQQEQETQNANIQEAQEDISTLKAENAELKEDLEDDKENQLTAPASGESIDLNDSANAKIREPKLIGKSWQKTRSGKNLFDGNNPTSENSAQVSFEDDIVTESSTITTMPPYSIWVLPVSEGDIIRLSGIILDTNGQIAIQKNNGSTNLSINSIFYNNGSTPGNLNYTVESGIVAVRVLLYANKTTPSGDSSSRYKQVIVTKNNSDMTYEEYGVMPSPDYPSEIHRTGDNGSINEKIQNANLFDLKSYLIKKGATYTENDDGSYTITLKQSMYSEPLEFSDENIVVSLCGLITNVTSNNFRIQLLNKNNGSAGVIDENTQVLNNKSASKLRFDWSGSQGCTVTMKNIMLNKGSTALPYIPPAEQNISFPLEEGQIVTQNDYIDDDGIHHVRAKVVLNGTENWEQTSTATSGKYRWLLNVSNVKATSSTSEIPQILATHYKAVAFAGGSGTYNNVQGISVANYGTKIGIYDDTNNTDLTTWKSYLAEQYTNGTPVEIEYDLAEEYVEPFTEEQAEAWELIKKIKTYKTVTHISSEDETPATMDMVYVRDLQTYLDNRFNELSSAIVAQGGV